MGHFAHHKSFGGAPIGEKYTTTPTQVKGANTYIIVGSLLPIWRTIPTEPLLQHLREPQLLKVKSQMIQCVRCAQETKDGRDTMDHILLDGSHILRIADDFLSVPVRRVLEQLIVPYARPFRVLLPGRRGFEHGDVRFRHSGRHLHAR